MACGLVIVYLVPLIATAAIASPPPIIIENESGYMKAGFGGDSTPKIEFPSVVGRPRFQGMISQQQEIYVGYDALAKAAMLTLSYPMSTGVITDWDDMEQIWHHTFNNELSIQSQDYAVLLTEPPLNPLVNREHMVQV